MGIYPVNKEEPEGNIVIHISEWDQVRENSNFLIKKSAKIQI